jgi:hypothetical protein
LDYPTTRTSLSPIRRGFAPNFVNYNKGCTRLAAASDKVCQLLAHGRWFSPGTPASSTTKTGRHDIAEILLKVALNTKNQSNRCYALQSFFLLYWLVFNATLAVFRLYVVVYLHYLPLYLFIFILNYIRRWNYVLFQYLKLKLKWLLIISRYNKGIK